jgi:pilus assembly protein Flp/PilA
VRHPLFDFRDADTEIHVPSRPTLATPAEPRSRSSKARAERGASAVEYGLLIAGIAAMIAVAVFAFGSGSNGLFNKSCQTIIVQGMKGSCS